VATPPPAARPAAIRAAYDCSTRRVVPGVGAVYERDVTYIAVDANGNELNAAVISEHLQLVKGKERPDESTQTDRLYDQYAVGRAGSYEVYQTFSVQLGGNTYSNLPIYNRRGVGAANNRNDVEVLSGGVFINNDYTPADGDCKGRTR
jgi:hypothetical protein